MEAAGASEWTTFLGCRKQVLTHGRPSPRHAAGTAKLPRAQAAYRAAKAAAEMVPNGVIGRALPVTDDGPVARGLELLGGLSAVLAASITMNSAARCTSICGW
jgi:hypothetical protein